MFLDRSLRRVLYLQANISRSSHDGETTCSVPKGHVAKALARLTSVLVNRTAEIAVGTPVDLSGITKELTSTSAGVPVTSVSSLRHPHSVAQKTMRMLTRYGLEMSSRQCLVG